MLTNRPEEPNNWSSASVALPVHSLAEKHTTERAATSRRSVRFVGSWSPCIHDRT